MIHHGTLSRTYERATNANNVQTRFHVLETYPQKLVIPEDKHGYTRFKTPALRLQSGDHVTVFNSIAAGNTLWKGELHFLGKNPQNGAHPMGSNKDQWEAMFNRHLPAQLTKADSGERIDGTLMKGVDRIDDGYNLYDFKKNSYESLHNFEDGDTLEIFSGITDGNIVWQGEIKIHPNAVNLITSLSPGELRVLKNIGAITQNTGPGIERIGNPFVIPDIKETQNWDDYLPIMLERN